jgi:hypothetical protein
MRYLTLILVFLWLSPAEAAKCPIYSYTPQPGQNPSGLLKLDRTAEAALLAQLPEHPTGKICWYASTDGTLSARAPNPTKVYVFRLDQGRWVYVETLDVVTAVG